MKTCLALILILLVELSFGQDYSTHDKKAIKLFEQAKLAVNSNLYSKSLKLLGQAINLDSTFLEAYLLNSDIYQELDSVSLQIKSLESAIRINTSKYPKLHFTLGNAYYRAGQYQKAIDSYTNYLQAAGQNGTFIVKARQNIEKCTGGVQLIKNPVPFISKNLGSNINSEDDEYWPSLTVDGKTIIFTRLVGASTKIGQGKALAQEDFYTSQLVDNQWQPSEPLTTINTNSNEGAQSISSDGKLLFFTACNRNDGFGSCDIYFSRNKGGTWSEPRNAGEPVNSPAWESQPSISANGESLFFVSNRKGGKGGMDIWINKIHFFF